MDRELIVPGLCALSVGGRMNVVRPIRRIWPFLAFLSLAPHLAGAQRSRVAAPATPAATAQLEVVADSAGQPIRINGTQVGVTPAAISMPASITSPSWSSSSSVRSEKSPEIPR